MIGTFRELDRNDVLIKIIETLISSKFQTFTVAIGAVVLVYLKGEIEGGIAALFVMLASAAYQWFRAYEDSNR